MNLVLSGEDLIKTTEGHMRNTCRKVNSQPVHEGNSRLGFTTCTSRE